MKDNDVVTPDRFVVSLSITQSWKEEGLDARPDDLARILAVTQRAWRISRKNANDAELVLAVRRVDGRRLVVGVFRHNQTEGWMPTVTPHRYVFLGEMAAEKDVEKYLGKYLPGNNSHDSNPVRYYGENFRRKKSKK